MPYKLTKDSYQHHINLDTLHTTITHVASGENYLKLLENIVSYLNQLEIRHDKWTKVMERLLMASLDRNGLGKVQEEVAVMLRFPGLDGFIKEKYGEEYSKVAKRRKKEESIISLKELEISGGASGESKE